MQGTQVVAKKLSTTTLRLISGTYSPLTSTFLPCSSVLKPNSFIRLFSFIRPGPLAVFPDKIGAGTPTILLVSVSAQAPLWLKPKRSADNKRIRIDDLLF